MTEKTIPSKSFYNGETKRKYLQLLQKRKLQTENLTTPVKNDMDRQSYKSCFGEQKVWKIFHRQQAAIEYMNSSKQINLSLFAIEKENAKRKFLVTTQKQFWCEYKEMTQDSRHYYEVILENAPCRVYFDIEYLYEFNPNTNALEVLETFIQLIMYCIYIEYNIKSSRKDFIDLSSSTEKKFSRHLILHLEQDNVLFANNYHIGEFLKEIVASLELFVLLNQTSKYLPVSETYTGDRDKLCKDMLKELYIQTENGQSLIFDQSVYSKNRNFRLYLSSKFSKNVCLQIAEENQFIFKRELSKLETQIYKIRNLNFEPDFQLFQDTLVTPCFDIRKSKTFLKFTDTSNMTPVDNKALGTRNRKVGKFSMKGSKKSDYPALDAFVLHHVNQKGSQQGWIRQWLCIDTSQLIIYSIDGNKYCGNIQREHKSNHIYYVVDLKLNHLYQKCFDPECWHYRSPEIMIPDEINPFFIQDDNDKENADNRRITTDNRKDENHEIKSPTNGITQNSINSEFDHFELDEFDFDDFDIEEFDLNDIENNFHNENACLCENGSPKKKFLSGEEQVNRQLNLSDRDSTQKSNLSQRDPEMVSEKADFELANCTSNFTEILLPAEETDFFATGSSLFESNIKKSNAIFSESELTEADIEELFRDEIDVL